MGILNDKIISHLKARGYSGVNYNDIVSDALKTSLSTTGSINDLWMQYLSAYSGNPNDRLNKYIDDGFFYTGSLQDKLTKLVTDPIVINKIIRSQELDHAAWDTNLITVVANDITAPDGTLTADKVVSESGTGNKDVEPDTTITLTANDVTTLSCYIKATGRQWVRIAAQVTGGAFVINWFDILNGVIGTTDAAVTSRITDEGDGWFRCSITWDIGTQTSNRHIISITSDDNVLTDTGDGAAGIYLWGIQSETNTEASGLIKTTTAATTRFLI